MEKKQAQELIKSIMEQPFDRLKFKNFIYNLLNNVEARDNHYSGNGRWSAFKQHVNQYWRIGKYTDPEGNEVDILVIETPSTAKLEQARASLRNFVVKHLHTFETDNKEHALAAFYSKEDGGADWRFSFIKAEHEAFMDQKGKVKFKKELTPAKRYSFLVGQYEESYTAQKQLLPLLETDYANPSIKHLESAFSIEKVTDEFFEQYKELYLKLTEYFDKDSRISTIIKNKNLGVPRFTKKLMGQIVFLYFLQKKGWLGAPKNAPWGKGEKKFLRKLWDNAIQKQENFYSHYLQYLFYEALAKERPEQDYDYYPRFDCRIPFLNGGLFEADYQWEQYSIEIPNELFSNDEKNKAGDIGTGILDVFDRYNFTIKEDEPLEKEVAVDPEMLGKVFENMLGITERKSTGAFYTPREIVHYMCQESLIQYLDSAVNEEKQQCPRDALELFIRKGHLVSENDEQVRKNGRETDRYKFQLPESIQKHATLLDKKLEEVRICDPAIGSGAFPVGLLNEIVNARLILQTILKTKEEEKIKAYAMKRHAIQESIYGVDIDASAVDIARLRLWLSLIVDRENVKENENHNKIEALPNLDYKIVCGNSLVGANYILTDNKAKKEIEELQDSYFSKTDQEEKKSLREKINIKIRKFLDSAEAFSGYRIDFDFELFFPRIWRGIRRNGFDIVIGNPPYVKESTNKNAFENTKKSECYQGKMDLWYLFGCKGIDILRMQGTLSFIATNNWITNDGASKFRNKVMSETKIFDYLDFGDYKIFKAGIQTMIVSLKKDTDNYRYKTSYRKVLNKNITKYELEKVLNRIPNSNYETFDVEIDKSEMLNNPIRFISKINSNVLLKIRRASNFKLFKNEVASGIDILQDYVNKKSKELLGDEIKIGDGIFNLTTDELKALNLDDKEHEIIKPFYTTKELHRYYGNPKNNYWVIYTDSSFKDVNRMSSYLRIKKHLDKFEKVMTSVNKPYGLHRARDERFFKGERIFSLRKCPESPSFTYVNFDAYVNRTFLIIKTDRINQIYLCAILNTKLVSFWLRFIGKMQGDNYQVDKEPLLNLPIVNIATMSQKPFERLFDYIVHTKTHNVKLQYTFFEQLIDGLVFELYFPEEVKAAGKEILSHLGDLRPITGEMSDSEKLSIIESEFERLYDPQHPVRNHLETLDSIEEVRIIQEVIQ